MPMSRIFLCFLLIAPAARADFIFTQPLANLGVVKAGVSHQHRFDFEVRGALPVEIVGFERSCGCLAPQWERTKFNPGEKGSLVIDVRSVGQPEGPHAWNARVVYRQGDERKTAPLTVHATVKNEVTVQPPRLAVFLESALPQEIKVHDRREKALQVIDVRCSVPGLTFDAKREAPGVTKITMLVRAANLPAERQEGKITITTDDVEYPQLEIPITLLKQAKQDFSVHPETIALHVGAGEPTSALVRIKQRDGAAVKIAKVEASHPALRFTWIAGPGNDATLRVSVAAKAIEPGTISASVQIYLEGDRILSAPVALLP